MASNLATLRTKANMKQEELAERLGLSRQTISAIENERRVMEWTTFSVLVMFFEKDEEIRQIMIALGILNDNVQRMLNGCHRPLDILQPYLSLIRLEM